MPPRCLSGAAEKTSCWEQATARFSGPSPSRNSSRVLTRQLTPRTRSASYLRFGCLISTLGDTLGDIPPYRMRTCSGSHGAGSHP